MPERSRILRRTAYLTALLTTLAVFGLSLNAIAGTQGQVGPGAGAPVTRALQQVRDGHHCHHGFRRQPQSAPAPAAGREV
jgi:hypothetical protein